MQSLVFSLMYLKGNLYYFLADFAKCIELWTKETKIGTFFNISDFGYF